MVAPEGRPLLVGAGVGAAIATYAVGLMWSAPLWVLIVGLLVVFYEPARIVPALPLAIISPVDGKVITVEEKYDHWLEREALVIGIQAHDPGITALRSPTEGKVMDFWTNLGTQGLSTRSPTEYAVWLQTDELDDVVMSVVTRTFSRFKADVAPGERVGQGQRNGFIFFVKRVDLLLPVESSIEVRLGDSVLAGSGVVAMLPRDESENSPI